MLFGINKMLEDIQRESPAKGLRTDFSISGKGLNWNGIYVEDGKLMGMLESKNYRSLDMVSPFMGKFTDRCSDEVPSALTTRLFVRYVDLMQKALSYNTNPVIWNEYILQELELMIKLFKIDFSLLELSSIGAVHGEISSIGPHCGRYKEVWWDQIR